VGCQATENRKKWDYAFDQPTWERWGPAGQYSKQLAGETRALPAKNTAATHLVG
jgi:hypothetical protein